MIYRIARSLLFLLSPELSHCVALTCLKFAFALKLNKISNAPELKPKMIMGLSFPNCVGLAAGLDKNGDYIDALANLGFGFIEIGTVTPKPQSGNPKPRLFRLAKTEAIINRMGFNNKGIDHLIAQLETAKYKGILGINIGKNAATPIEEAVSDYLIGMRKAYPYASYITINISSPNTQGLRTLQHGTYLLNLLTVLKQEQNLLRQKYQKSVPLVVKVAPDLTPEEIESLAKTFIEVGIDGVCATNTTISRDNVTESQFLNEPGGLSGRPLFNRSTEVLRMFKQALKGQIPIIASGGILSQQDAAEKMAAGADLIQLYTGLIYQGPQLIRECLKANPL